MHDAIATIAWPTARLPEAIEVLARRAGLRPNTTEITLPPCLPNLADRREFEPWLEWFCTRIDIEMESVESTVFDYTNLLRGAGPAVLHYQHIGESSVLLLLSATTRHVQFIGPDLRVRRYPLSHIRAALCDEVERPVRAAVEALLPHANIPVKNRADVIQLLVQEQVAGKRMDACWTLRIPPTRSFWLQMQWQRMPGRAAAMLTVFIGLYVTEILGWMVIGRGALEGRLDDGWLVAWVLLLLLLIPIQLVGTWLQGLFAIDFGTLLKQRLLSGALHMKIDEVRRTGIGQLVGKVMESQALESLAFNGGFSVMVASIELIVAAWVLIWGAGGSWHVLTLLLWVLGTLTACWWYFRHLRQWVHARIDLTHELIEQMVGHRTRLAQEALEQRHLREDRCLERFLQVSADFDRTLVPLSWGISRGWLIVGVLGLVPALTWGQVDLMGLAVSLGGVSLAQRAFGEIGSSLASLARAAVAWELIQPLFVAAHRSKTECLTSPSAHRPLENQDLYKAKHVCVQARDVVYHYERTGDPVLNRCTFTLYHGDHVLLEGQSGSGKSTLTALLVGLRQPDSGLLMLNGLDRATLGQRWQQLSTAASQFHENHVFTGTVAFNLLMGCHWPPTAADLAEAKQLCEELGLGDVLNRMPSGMMQMVGETGWQLSHGERSRLFLARTLLQKAELVVLDESFAALDPETLTKCLQCVRTRAHTLVVIAHP